MPQVFLTKASSSPWTVPSDFGSFVSIDTIGAGGSGGCRSATGSTSASGGGGGGWSRCLGSDLTGLGTIVPGVTTFPFIVGSGGAGKTSTGTGQNGAVGGDTAFNAASLAAAVTNGT